MTFADNPWFKVLHYPQGESTSTIASYFSKQGKMLMEASDGKVEGVFAETRVVNNALSPYYDFADTISAVSKLGSIQRTPELNLIDADKMYEKQDYCFEIRSKTYRFRLLTLEFGPLYPVTMYVDDGVFRDLSKSSGRFTLSEEGKPRPLTIENGSDLNEVFQALMGSKKLNYICARLMEESQRESS